jgi:2-dehydro-3-deoxyphosphooctonate aldolase (KDO 8-P synthase)
MNREYNGSVNQVAVGDVVLGNGQPLALIAGPCVIENESHVLEIANSVQEIAERCGIPLIFKASFDKANRTSIASFRGPGLQEGMRILARVKKEIGIPILTDIHEVHQAKPVAEVADIIQIPAFLSRQTDLLVAAAATGRVVNVKKGQFLSPHDVQHVLTKVTSTGHNKILITERGTSFGYNNLVVDMRAFPILQSMGFPVVFDVTHSLQLPGAGDGVTSGQSEYIPTLAAAGVAAGVDVIFMEVHDSPDQAKSDGKNALAIDELEPLLRHIGAIAQLTSPKS